MRRQERPVGRKQKTNAASFAAKPPSPSNALAPRSGALALAVLTVGLFERWLEIERATGRPLSAILTDLNDACDTKYKHNWPSVMAERGYSLDRLPTNVRRYMMRKVLPAEMKALDGKALTAKKIDALIVNLT